MARGRRGRPRSQPAGRLSPASSPAPAPASSPALTQFEVPSPTGQPSPLTDTLADRDSSSPPHASESVVPSSFNGASPATQMGQLPVRATDLPPAQANTSHSGALLPITENNLLDASLAQQPDVHIPHTCSPMSRSSLSATHPASALVAGGTTAVCPINPHTAHSDLSKELSSSSRSDHPPLWLPVPSSPARTRNPA